MHAETDVEPKALEILDRIKGAFALKGFDGASMQDLARAAGMSAGNFYRYFPSKSAIVEAIVERELALVRAEFERLIASNDPPGAFRDMVRERIEAPDDCDCQLWVEIEAAATRRPEIAAPFARMEAELVEALIDVFARVAGMSQAEAARRFTAQARLMILLVQGVSTRSVTGAGSRRTSADRELAALVIGTIETMLAEIAAFAPARAVAAELAR